MVNLPTNIKAVISIVIVVFNNRNEIELTIQSIINQNYPNIEFIIIDGGSNDGTKEIISNYYNKIDKFISEKDNGIFDAMNKGLSQATGDFINFMNAGDIFANEDVISNIFNTDLINYGIIYGNTIKITKYGKKESKSNPFWLRKGIHEMGICHQSIFLRTKLAQKYRFDTNLKLTADYKMIFNIISNEKIAILDFGHPVSIFNAIDGASSVNYTTTYNEIITFINPYSKIHKMYFLYKSYFIFYLYQFYKHIKYFKIK